MIIARKYSSTKIHNCELWDLKRTHMNLFVNYKEIIEYFLMNVNTQARIFSNKNNSKGGY